MSITIPPYPGLVYAYDAPHDLHVVTYTDASPRAAESFLQTVRDLHQRLSARPDAETLTVRLLVDSRETGTPPIHRLAIGLQAFLPEIRTHRYAAIRYVSLTPNATLGTLVQLLASTMPVPRLSYRAFYALRYEEAIAWLTSA